MLEWTDSFLPAVLSLERRFDPVERRKGELLVVGFGGLEHHPTPIEGG